MTFLLVNFLTVALLELVNFLHAFGRPLGKPMCLAPPTVHVFRLQEHNYHFQTWLVLTTRNQAWTGCRGDSCFDGLHVFET